MDTRIFICFIAVLRTTSGAVAPAGQEQDVPQDISNDAVGSTPTVMNANVIVDDVMKVFADGQLIGTNAVWNQAMRYQIPRTTEIVAIEAKNLGGPYGIRASFDGARLVTDNKRWRCSASRSSNWLKPSFDDSQWPLAKVIKYPAGDRINNKERVNINAKWIWTESPEDETVYCRAFLDVDGYVQVDDKMEVFADGKLLGTNSLWSVTKSFTFPGKTHVIAISGKNTGGPYGIRASFGGKKLLTSNLGRWRCTNTLIPDWEKPSYNDKTWPVATKVQHNFQGATNVDSSAKWIWGGPKIIAYCRAFLHMFATLVVDDRMAVYADGILVGTNSQWNKGVRFRMPGETQLVAIKATNTGGPYGIKGFFAAGRLVTGSNWKCTHVATPNWNKPTFDDSTWPAARVVQHRARQEAFNGVAVTGHGSQWIWAASRSAAVVYCRGFIRSVPVISTAAKGLEDTRPQAHTEATGQVADNAAVAKGNQGDAAVAKGNQGDQGVQNTAGNNMAEDDNAGGNVAADDEAAGNEAGTNTAANNRPMFIEYSERKDQ